MIYPIICTIFGTLFCINNIYSNTNNKYNIIFNIIVILLLWEFLSMQFSYKYKYLNYIYAIITTIIGSIISFYILIKCNVRLYYYNIYKGITSGTVLNDINNKTKIEYIVDNIKYSIKNFDNKYKLNEKLTIIYNYKNPQNSLVYLHKNVINNKLAIIAAIILLIIVWIIFIDKIL